MIIARYHCFINLPITSSTSNRQHKAISLTLGESLNTKQLEFSSH